MSELEPRVLTVDVTEPAPGVDLLTLTGELDFASGRELATALARLAGRPRRIVVDLSPLQFVDSSGVKMLVSAARNAESDGGGLVLVSPTPSVQRVFEILHLYDVMTVVPDLQHAIDASARRAGGEAPRKSDAGG
jgi:anti-sigma B factor antagonist